MSPAFSGLGPTVGTYAERLAIASPQIGQLFYQTDTDEYVKYGTDTDGTQRWMLASNDYGRNLVVNGGFDVWQRATSATTSTADYYGPADRWQTTRLSSDTGRTFSRQPVTSSDTPVSGFTYFMRCQRDASNAAVNSILMATSFETTSVRRTQNKYVTLSFFARAGANYSAASGFLRAFITTGTGTDGRLITSTFTSPATLVDSNNVLTTSWKRFTVTTSAPVGSTVTQMGITFQFSPVGTAGAADYYDITGVQLEACSAPSDFEFEPYDTTLRKCQRYYEQYNWASGVILPQSAVSADNANRPEFILNYSQKRIAPVLSLSAVNHITVESFTSYTSATSTSGIFTYVGTGVNNANVFVPVASWPVWTNSFAYLNTSGAWLGISAEL